jgi:hypothetical protein
MEVRSWSNQDLKIRDGRKWNVVVEKLTSVKWYWGWHVWFPFVESLLLATVFVFTFLLLTNDVETTVLALSAILWAFNAFFLLTAATSECKGISICVNTRKSCDDTGKDDKSCKEILVVHFG